MDQPRLESILNVSMQDIVSGVIQPNVESSLRIKAFGAAGIRTPDALMHRIHECIHANSLRGIGSRLVTLNRQYARTASRCGTTIHSMVGELLHQSKIVELDAGGITCLYSASVWNERVAVAESMESLGALNAIALMRDETVAQSR